MDRLKRRFSFETAGAIRTAMLWLFFLALLVVDVVRGLNIWERNNPYFAGHARTVREIAIGFVIVVGVVLSGTILSGLRAILLRTWSFYRRGESGFEGAISRISPGDSLAKLLVARRFFSLESRVISTSPRPTVVHCPMCRSVLIGYPTDQVRCPNCAQGIAYLQLAMDFDAIARGAMIASGPTFGWVPRHVGQFLKKRYGDVWR